MSMTISDASPTAAAATRFEASHAWRELLGRYALALSAGVWSVFFLVRSTLFLFAPGHTSDWRTLSARALASACGALLCLLIHLLLRNRPRHPWQMLFSALALAVPCAALLDVIGVVIWRTISDYYVHNPERWFSPREMIEDFLTYLWVFFAWSALYVSAANALELRRQDQALAAARAAAQEAQLLALRLQIHPHFLFNTLNTIAGLISLGRNAESERTVLTLSRFMRRTLATPPSQHVPLADELSAVREYLDIETVRFQDRLRVHYAIDPGSGRALVPSLILLPLVENSIKYGLAESEDGITLTISAERDGSMLVLRVDDDGTGAHNGQDGLGIGLRNVHERLLALFGDDAKLQAGPLARGWRSAILIPWQQ